MNKLQSKQAPTPDIGRKNRVKGRSMSYWGELLYPAGQQEQHLLVKNLQIMSRSLKNKK
ncbi:hypothetical protein [Niabella hibiscisoli]|uniref:hypothetical protein n=1 Tax=Niabella hibiscisoli TaxID=1825928 RepID=UPI001F0F5F37|nr:hypothetical protein [Niabella hibiscisoli]MCH5718772.1 hypothetical protein [Niabella hibiscisoli]